LIYPYNFLLLRFQFFIFSFILILISHSCKNYYLIKNDVLTTKTKTLMNKNIYDKKYLKIIAIINAKILFILKRWHASPSSKIVRTLNFIYKLVLLRTSNSSVRRGTYGNVRAMPYRIQLYVECTLRLLATDLVQNNQHTQELGRALPCEWLNLCTIVILIFC